MNEEIKSCLDAGINSIPVKVALNYKINDVFYAEHGESEYGGLVLDEERKRDLKRSLNIKLDYPENWVNEQFEKDIMSITYPSDEDLKKLNHIPLFCILF